MTSSDIKTSSKLSFTSDIEDIKACSTFIVTVPTPIDSSNTPDLNPLRSACKEIGKILKKNDVVIFESTVYPGATEEICVPILEQFSGLKFNQEFYAGYSPERINPGDKVHTIANITKITSGPNFLRFSFLFAVVFNTATRDLAMKTL